MNKNSFFKKENYFDLLIKNKNIGICSYDSGGANVINSLIKRKGIKPKKYFINGPAKIIFNKKKNIDNKLDFDILISSTGTSDFEKKIINKCINRGIEVFCFFDHWTNYKQRLILNKKILRPSYLIGTDYFSLKKLRHIFRDSKLIFVKNYYLRSIKQNLLTKKKSKREFDYGYLSSNNKNEQIVFSKFIDNLIKKKKNNFIKILYRAHPSEKIKNYKIFYKNRIEIKYASVNQRLEKFLMMCNIYVGYDSMSLVVAKFCRLRVINICKLNKSKIPYKLN